MKTKKAKSEIKSSMTSILFRRTLGKPVKEVRQSVYAQGTTTQLHKARTALLETRKTGHVTQKQESAYVNLIFKTRSDIARIQHRGLRGKTWKDHNIFLLKD